MCLSRVAEGDARSKHILRGSYFNSGTNQGHYFGSQGLAVFAHQPLCDHLTGLCTLDTEKRLSVAVHTHLSTHV
jgi:hypothetical protein